MTEIAHILETRKNFIELIDSLTTEQLNKIPEGYWNNIIWNFGHTIVTQQILCYKLAGKPLNVSDEMVNKYRKGSKPEGNVSEAEITEFKKMGLELINQMENDLKTDSFENYTPYVTSYHVKINTIEDALKFDSLHEGLHLGYAMAMKKLVL